MLFIRRRRILVLAACLTVPFLTGPAAGQKRTASTPAKGEKPEQAAAKPPQKTKPVVNPLDPELREAIKSAPNASEWPNSNAARILDLVNVEMKPDGTVVADYRTTLKLFNERARNLAEVSLPYNASYQTLSVTKARTIKKDGRVIEVSPSEIRVTSPYSDYALYDDSVVVGFSMPGVEDDCIIDYSWRETTKPLLMPGQFWDFWAFTGSEPVTISRYVLKAPATKNINFRVYNDNSIKPAIVTTPDGKNKLYTWKLEHIKPIEVEPSMPAMREVHVWMEVSTLSSWQDISGWFWKLARPQAVATDPMRKTVESVIASKRTDREKAAAIYDWVANRVRYVGLEFGLSAFKPHAAPDVYDKLYGDCKDKALLLVTMLNLAGIKAHPVLLHTDDRKQTEAQLPTLNAFDHCIALAEVDGVDVWLDATAETCAYGDIPEADRGSQGLVVKDGKAQFSTIPRYVAEENGIDSTTKVALKQDGSASVKVQLDMRGEAAQQLRSYVRGITPEQRKQAAQAMAQSYTVGGIVTDYSLPDGIDKTGPYVMKLSVSAPNRTRRTKNLLILPLGGISGGSSRSNPFVKEDRIWPIVVEEAGLQKTETVISLPDGCIVEDTPPDLNIVAPLHNYQRTVAVSPDGRTVTVRTTSTSKPGRIPPSDYLQVKGYYDKVLNAAEDVIVIRKLPLSPKEVSTPGDETPIPGRIPERGQIKIKP